VSATVPPDGHDAADDRATSSKEIRDRRKVVEFVLEKLPPALASKAIRMAPGPNGTTVVWSQRGQMLASCVDQVVAQFLVDCPGFLRAFSAYIEQLEASAYHDRERRRQAEDRVEVITNELLAAADAGFKTDYGQKRLQNALREAREHQRSVTRVAPPNRTWRY
jgi:hypothetical protein